jgi:small subunit ribosomal protein S16
MLKIKLQRTGRKHEPTFRLLLTESKNSTKTGKFLEVLGSHDFRKENTELKKDRIQYWLKQGVKPTPTVHNLLVTHKIVDGKKVNVLPRRTPKEKKTK